MPLLKAQIQSLLGTISATLKTSSAGKKNEPAGWGPLYAKACMHACEIEVHSCGDFPEKLIGDNFPGETDEEKSYRRKSFQPVTKPYWKKAMRTINRIWAEQNYGIEFNNDAAKKYFLEDYPVSNDIRAFFKSIVTEAKISDPNGVLVVDFELPVKENAQGEIVIDDSKELEPYATVYDCDDVLLFESGELCLVMSEEKSEVEYAGKKEKLGAVMYLYDDATIYRIYQVGKKVDWKFEVATYYEHNLGYLPCWKLKGTPEDVILGEVFYESYFAPAIPHLNEAIIIHSTNKSVRNKVSYPTRVHYDQPCTNRDCNNGMVWIGAGTDAKQSKCGTCGGTGSLKFSPFRDFVHELPTATRDTGKDAVAFPGLAYVAPDGTIIKDNEEVIDKYLDRAFLFLNIEVNASGNQKGLTDPTATKSKIDRDEQYISMLDISNELFWLMQQFINAAYKLRFNEESQVKIKPPVTFDLVSTDELATRLGQAKKDGLSDFAVSEMTVQLMEQEFPQTVARKAEIAQYSDVLFIKTEMDISTMQASRRVEPWQVLLHTNFERYLNELMEANADFLTQELKAIDKALVERAKKDEATQNAGKVSADALLNGIATGAGMPTA